MPQKSKQHSNNVKALIKPIIVIAVFVGAIGGGYLGLALYLGSSTPLVVVTSESMHPVYWEGDILFVKYSEPDEIVVGTDIVFHADWIPSSSPDANIPVVHRVVDKQYIGGVWYFWTQGVNTETNPYPDPEPTPYSNVIGRVVFAIPRIGLPLLALRPVAGYLQYLFITIAVLLTIYVVYDYYSESRGKNSQSEGKLWSDEELADTDKLSREEDDTGESSGG